jgi:hypothetical protein
VTRSALRDDRIAASPDGRTAQDRSAHHGPLARADRRCGKRLAQERRDFIQIFTWIPDDMRSSWHFMWSLSEVVGDRLEGVTGEALVTMEGAEPPDPRDFVAHRFATVRLNASGQAEWAIIQGPHAGREVIETAQSGSATFRLARAGIRTREPGRRRVIIQIEGAELLGPSGTRIRAPRPITISATVGGFTGWNGIQRANRRSSLPKRATRRLMRR